MRKSRQSEEKDKGYGLTSSILSKESVIQLCFLIHFPVSINSL